MFKNYVYKISRIVVLVALFPYAVQAEQKVLVGIASDSAVKKTAVKRAFERIFPEGEILVNAYSVESGVADQPVGKENGIQGAENRLIAAKQAASLSASQALAPDYWISVENYIEETAPATWIDRAVVLVEKSGNSPVLEYSEAVSFPESFALRAKELSSQGSAVNFTGYPITIGKLIQQEFSKKGEILAHDNWHSHPHFGNQSRQSLIEDALVKAVVKSEIVLVTGFKKAGIQFRDMTPLLGNPEVFKAAIQLLALPYKALKVDAVAGLEARGFLLGVPLAMELKVPFIPVRKKGKLPNASFSQRYTTEYSEDEIEIAATDLKGKTVLLIDDLLATGGTLKAAEDLMKLAGAVNTYATCLIELPNLGGKAKLNSDFKTLIQF